MENDKSPPRWTQWLAGGVLLAVAVTAGGLSLTLNVSQGLETGVAAALAFGLGDIGKLAIPVVGGIVGWSKQMRVTAAICVATSLWCAINYYADHHGRDLLAKQHAVENNADKVKAVAELESEVAFLRAQITQEAAKKGCGPICRTLGEQASAASLRLSEARHVKAEAKPTEISGLAVMVAMATGASPDGIARGIGAIKALIFLVLLEALVWLSIPAMVLLSPAARRREAEPETAIDETAATAMPANPAANPAAKPKSTKTGRDYWLGRLQKDHPALAAEVESGKRSVYAACLQTGLRKPGGKSWTKVDSYLQSAVAT